MYSPVYQIIVLWLLDILWTDSGPPTTGLQTLCQHTACLRSVFLRTLCPLFCHQMSNFQTNRFSHQIIVCVHDGYWSFLILWTCWVWTSDGISFLELNCPLRQSSQRRRYLKIGHDQFYPTPTSLYSHLPHTVYSPACIFFRWDCHWLTQESFSCQIDVFKTDKTSRTTANHRSVIFHYTVVKVLCYKSEGRWFDPSWCQWIFDWHKILPIALWT